MIKIHQTVTNRLKAIAYFAVVAIALFVGIPRACAVQPPPEGFKTAELSIKTASGTHHFDIEIAQSQTQQQYGLMHRKSMLETHGMLFIQGRDKNISMWMKDTDLSLDMLFIASDGHIVYIAHDATPYSTAVISAGQPVRAVLELLGGAAAKFNIQTGDRVIYPDFKP